MLFSHNYNKWIQMCTLHEQCMNGNNQTNAKQPPISSSSSSVFSLNLCKDRTGATRSDGDNSAITSLLFFFFPAALIFSHHCHLPSTFTSQDAVQSVTLHLSQQSSSNNKSMWSKLKIRGLKKAILDQTRLICQGRLVL